MFRQTGAWARHPETILVAAIAYAIVYDRVFWTLLLTAFLTHTFHHTTAATILYGTALILASARLGALLEQTGITKHLRDRKK